MPSFVLDERLNNDTISLGKYELCQVRLHKNALYPWFILVPEVEVTEFYELSSGDQSQVIKLINQLSLLVKQSFSVEKLNVATIGNIVKQMHIHIIGRHSNDTCWPAPVWGHEAFEPYVENEIIDIQQILINQLDDNFKPETD